MPPRKYYKKKWPVKKAVAKKGLKDKRSRMQRLEKKLNAVNWGMGIPSRVLFKQKYHSIISFASVSGSFTYHQFRLNSIYDSDLTGIGHEPMYRDQINVLFQHYVVLATKVKIRFTTDNDNDIAVCVRATKDSTTPGFIDQERELPFSRGFTIDKNQSYNFKQTYKSRKILEAGKGQIYTDDTYLTAVGSNPNSNKTVYLNVSAVPMDLASSCNIRMDVELIFYVLLTGRVTQSSS